MLFEKVEMAEIDIGTGPADAAEADPEQSDGLFYEPDTDGSLPGLGSTALQPELKTRKLPDFEAQNKLFQNIHVGDRAARETIFETYAPLAYGLAKRYAGGHEPLEDLRQVASIGLLKAINKFDLDKGNMFSSYAVPTIMGEIQHHMRNNTWPVHMPRPLQESSLKADHAMESLEQQGKNCTVQEIAKELDVAEDEAAEALLAKGSRQLGSLQAPVGEEGEGSLADIIPDPDAESAYDEVAIKQAISQLPEQQQKIVTARRAQLSQRQIAELVGLSQMHVSRLLRIAKKELAPLLDEDLPLAS
jgi:RNA polymerase sigma-B factor